MTFYGYKRVLNFKESRENLQASFRESAPAFSENTYWFREFKRSRDNLNDDPRPGRPLTAVTYEKSSG